jgi:tRNA A37 N6-isopentenylltransferase MiaA
MSAGDWADAAAAAAADIAARGKVPIVVGGTGFYLRWCAATALLTWHARCACACESAAQRVRRLRDACADTCAAACALPRVR